MVNSKCYYQENCQEFGSSYIEQPHVVCRGPGGEVFLAFHLICLLVNPAAVVELMFVSPETVIDMSGAKAAVELRSGTRVGNRQTLLSMCGKSSHLLIIPRRVRSKWARLERSTTLLSPHR